MNVREEYKEAGEKGKPKEGKPKSADPGTRQVKTGKLKGTGTATLEDGSQKTVSITVDDVGEQASKQWLYGRPFVTLFIGDDSHPEWGAPAEELVEILTNRELKVFFRLLRKGAWDSNFAPVNTSQLGREMGMAQPNVARAIARMVEANVLLRHDDKDGRHYQYRINPYLLWRGGAKSYNEEARRQPICGIGEEKELVKRRPVRRKDPVPEGMHELVSARNTRKVA